MAYQPDDDRFYDSLNQAGQTYLQQRQKVAEDQAATTRAIGQSYGQAMTGAVNGALTGAQWAQNRAVQQQKMDVTQSSEERAQQKFAEDQQDRQTQQAAAQQQLAFENAPAEESYAKGAGIDYQPGMTHKQVEQMAGANALGFKDRQITSEEQRAKDTLQGTNQRAADVQSGDTARSQATIQAQADRQQELLAFDREKDAAATERERMKLANVKPKDVPAEMLNKLSDADNAQKSADAIADEYKKRVGPMSGATQYLPGSDAKKYNDALDLNAKNIADYMKGGRGSATPADTEFVKDNLLPSAGDSPERGSQKLTRLSQEIADRKNGHISILKQGGYNMSGINADAMPKTYDLSDKGDSAAIAAPGGGSGFPRKVMKGNKSATVSNPQELQEAQAEGFQ